MELTMSCFCAFTRLFMAVMPHRQQQPTPRLRWGRRRLPCSRSRAAAGAHGTARAPGDHATHCKHSAHRGIRAGRFTRRARPGPAPRGLWGADDSTPAHQAAPATGWENVPDSERQRGGRQGVTLATTDRHREAGLTVSDSLVCPPGGSRRDGEGGRQNSPQVSSRF